MNSKISKILSAALLLVMIMLISNSVEVQADLLVTSNPNSALLTSQGNTASNTSIMPFGSATINMAGSIAAISITDYIRVNNTTNTNTGWNIIVTASNFIATSVPDSSSAVGGATLSVTIPANTMLTVKPQTPTKSGTASLTGVTAQNTSGSAVTIGGVKVLSAATNRGNDGNNGYYLQQLNYTLTLPTYLPSTATISSAQADSKFTVANRTPGAKIGLFAATYSSNLIYSITAGP
jgi:hypothetical protein